jgi:hypothetical protein
MRKIWAILVLVAALTVPSVVAAFVLPTVETAHAQGKPPTPGKVVPCTRGVPAPFCPAE